MYYQEFEITVFKQTITMYLPYDKNATEEFIYNEAKKTIIENLDDDWYDISYGEICNAD